MRSRRIGLALVLFLALAAVVVALARQIGVLHERVAPAGALMTGGRRSMMCASLMLPSPDMRITSASGIHWAFGWPRSGSSVATSRPSM